MRETLAPNLQPRQCDCRDIGCPALAQSEKAAEDDGVFEQHEGPRAVPFPLEYALFAATLIGVALLHHHTLKVALIGLGAITLYKFFFTGFEDGAGFAGLGNHLAHEGVTIANLFLLLTGFALLSRHFEESRAPDVMPNILPHHWTGGAVLLGIVFVMSAFLDNIAAALIGGTIARHVFQGKVRIGYLAAIVASANAGGSGSVVGDTTTTMMWIAGISPLQVLSAYVPAIVAFCMFAAPAALAQHKHAPISKYVSDTRVDWTRIGVCVAILVSAIGANVAANLFAPDVLKHWPVIGLAVWAALAACAPIAAPDLKALPAAALGAVFLLALVLAASLLPLEALPAPSWPSTFGLGFLSAVFDNIPLTALAIRQGGYDWGMLAFAVGYGGSMLWFGSSAGVALTSQYPEAKNALRWLREGWFVAAGYVAGFLVMVALLGWRPN
jgi:Na+/H+ antiporter NhaD/arsenite permease-like protein